MIRSLIVFSLLHFSVSYSQSNCDSIQSMMFYNDSLGDSEKNNINLYFPAISECLELDQYEYKIFFDKHSLYYNRVIKMHQNDTIYVKEIIKNIEKIRSSAQYEGLLGLIKFKSEYCNTKVDENSWLKLKKAFENYGFNSDQLQSIKEELFSEKNKNKTYCEIGFNF